MLRTIFNHPSHPTAYPSSILYCLIVAVLAVIIQSEARSDTLFSNLSGESAGPPTSDLSLGTQFTVGALPVTVSSLGVYDEGQDGLLVAHDVGIYRVSDQSFIGGTTIPSGQTADLSGVWRFVDVSFTLEASETYMLVSQWDMSQDQNCYNGTYQSTSLASVQIPSDYYAFSSTLTYPSNDAASVTYTLHNAVINVVPEPSTLSLLAIGSGVLLIAGWRRRIRGKK